MGTGDPRHPAPKAQPLQTRRIGTPHQRRGFTIVELFVCIGIIVVLIGLALPTFKSSRLQAAMARDQIQVGQIANLSALYCNDHKDVYPLHLMFGPEVMRAAESFDYALLNGGYINRLEDIDADGYRSIGRRTVYMSWALVMSPQDMLPSTAPLVELQFAQPIRQSEVTLPNLEATYHRFLIPGIRNQKLITPLSAEFAYFCCEAEPFPTPVALADGAVTVGSWLDFIQDPSAFAPINSIGIPALSMWEGVRGRDLFRK